jgi:CheY-like chemotaxis protein
MFEGVTTRSGRLLIIDDEPMMLRVLRRVLEPPHVLVTVGTAAEGLALLRNGERYDVILCDLMMPQMTGMQLHAEVMTIDAVCAEQIVFLTGGAFTPEMDAFLSKSPNACVQKPFDMVALKALIAERLK